MRIRYSEEAASELEAAAHWYEEDRPGLGSEFIMSLEAILASIRRTSQLYAQAHRSDVRRALIKRFPYGLFFRETDNAFRTMAPSRRTHIPQKPLIFVKNVNFTWILCILSHAIVTYYTTS